MENFDKIVEACVGKLNKEEPYDDLSWSEIVSYLGIDWHPDSLRRMAYGIHRYHEYLQETNNVNVTDEDVYNKLLEKEVEIKKMMTKLSDMRILVNKEIREQARYEQLLDMLKSEIQSIPSDRKLSISDIETLNNRKECICAMSDIHYGITIDNQWNKFDSDIAYKRMNRLMEKTVEVGKSNNCEIVHLFIGGDLINNNIHLTSRMSNRETVTQQVVGVSELISQAIYCLHTNFKYVMVHMCSGNHDRIIPSKDMNDYEDNFVNVIKEFVKVRTGNLDNVIFNANEYGHDIVKFNVCGKSIIGLHGDKVSSKQVIQRLNTMYGQVDYVLSGHVHHDKLESFSNSKQITIPSFSGTDEYARQLALYSRPTQKIIVLENNSNDELIYTVDLS